MSLKDARQIGGKPDDAPRNDERSAIDASAIRELAELLTETGLSEIEIEQKGLRIRVCRETVRATVPAVTHAPAAMPAAEVPASRRDGHAPGTVVSPMVGTVYVSPQPGAAPFVKAGDTVKEGDTLLIVEAMKTMNPILAPRAGTITEICIHDAEPVEFGQALLVLS